MGGTRARQAATVRPPARAPGLPQRVMALQRGAGNRATAAMVGRAQLATQLAQHFGVGKVAAGTKAQQLADVAIGQAPPPTDLPDWHAWDPGASNALYADVLGAFEDMARVLGGTPEVKEVRFYKTAYEVDGGKAVPKHGVGADFSAGILNVYDTASAKVYKRLRSGDGFDKPDYARSRRRIIVHELAHGVAEAFATPGRPGAEADFFKAWGAAADGRAITPYAETSPAEDFAESVMAYVDAPDLLQAASPGRHAFIEGRKARWAPNLRART